MNELVTFLTNPWLIVTIAMAMFTAFAWYKLTTYRLNQVEPAMTDHAERIRLLENAMLTQQEHLRGMDQTLKRIEGLLREALSKNAIPSK